MKIASPITETSLIPTSSGMHIVRLTTPTLSTLIELDAVGLSVGRTAILAPLSLRITSGEFVGILGPNGAGKSSLLALMNATVRPTFGRVRLLSEDPWTLSERSRATLRSRVATVLQRIEYNPLVPLSARDVVAIGLLGVHGLAGRFTAEEHVRIDSALAQLGVAELARRAYRNLSGGEQQKVQLARALVQRPEMLLLDEPTTGLDLDWQERLVELISDLSLTHDLTIVMTTHALHHLPACCQRIILLRAGRVLFDGPASQALTADWLGKLYGCPVEIIERAGRRYCLGTAGGQL